MSQDIIKHSDEPFRWKPALISCLIVSIGQLSMGLVFPSLPWIAKDFAVSPEQAQLLISVYLFVFGPSQLIYGPLSDVFGRKPILLSGLFLLLIGLGFTIFASGSFHALVLGRFLQGLGAGSVAVLSRACLRDSYMKKHLVQAIGWLSIVSSVTPIIAPVVGGFLNHYFGWLSIFIFLSIYVLIVFFGISLLFKETLKNKQKQSVFKMIASYKELIHDKYFLNFAGIGWVNYALIVITISMMPFIMQVDIGMSSDIYALWALIPAFGFLVGALICAKLRIRFGLERVLKTVPYIHFSAGIWLIICPLTPVYVMFGQFILTLANGMAFPCAQSQMMMPYKSRSGTVAAMSGACQMLFASIISAALLHLGIKHLWHLGIILIIASCFGYFLIKNGFKQKKILYETTFQDDE